MKARGPPVSAVLANGVVASCVCDGQAVECATWDNVKKTWTRQDRGKSSFASSNGLSGFGLNDRLYLVGDDGALAVYHGRETWERRHE